MLFGLELHVVDKVMGGNRLSLFHSGDFGCHMPARINAVDICRINEAEVAVACISTNGTGLGFISVEHVCECFTCFWSRIEFHLIPPMLWVSDSKSIAGQNLSVGLLLPVNDFPVVAGEVLACNAEVDLT